MAPPLPESTLVIAPNKGPKKKRRPAFRPGKRPAKAAKTAPAKKKAVPKKSKEKEDSSAVAFIPNNNNIQEEAEEAPVDLEVTKEPESPEAKSTADNPPTQPTADADDETEEEDGGDLSTQEETENDGLSEYERLRLERIKRNQERLKELGLLDENKKIQEKALQNDKKDKGDESESEYEYESDEGDEDDAAFSSGFLKSPQQILAATKQSKTLDDSAEFCMVCQAKKEGKKVPHRPHHPNCTNKRNGATSNLDKLADKLAEAAAEPTSPFKNPESSASTIKLGSKSNSKPTTIKAKIASPIRAKTKTEVYRGPPDDDLGELGEWPPGWIKTIKTRQGSAKKDRYWYSPSGQMFQSLFKAKEVLAGKPTAAVETSSGTEIYRGPPDDDLGSECGAWPAGWTKTIVKRQGSNRNDCFFYSPSGKRYRGLANVIAVLSHKPKGLCKEVLHPYDYRGPPDDDLGELGEWPPGWIKTIERRPDSNRTDRYWYSPNGRKFSSLVKAKEALSAKPEAVVKTSPAKQKNGTEIYRGPPDDDLGSEFGDWPPGWTKTIVKRQGGDAKSKTLQDSFWYSPSGKQYTSLVRVKAFLSGKPTSVPMVSEEIYRGPPDDDLGSEHGGWPLGWIKPKDPSGEIYRGPPDDDLGECGEWPPGWIKTIVKRQGGDAKVKTHHDRFWYSPSGKKYNSLAGVKDFLSGKPTAVPLVSKEIYRGPPDDDLGSEHGEWPLGWIKTIVKRQGGDAKAKAHEDTFWYSPSNKQYTTLVGVKEALSVKPKPKTEVYRGPPDDDLGELGEWPPGWIKIIKTRPKSSRKDSMWYSPSGQKFESLVKAKEVLAGKPTAAVMTFPKPKNGTEIYRGPPDDDLGSECGEWPPGWTKSIVETQRGDAKAKTCQETFWYSPSGKQYTSLANVRAKFSGKPAGEEIYRGPPDDDLGELGEWPTGWTKTILKRQGCKTRPNRTDRFWYSPSGQRFSTLVKVKDVIAVLSGKPKPKPVPKKVLPTGYRGPPDDDLGKLGEWPPGWIKTIRKRPNSNRTDPFWYSPSGQRFPTLVKAKEALLNAKAASNAGRKRKSTGLVVGVSRVSAKKKTRSKTHQKEEGETETAANNSTRLSPLAIAAAASLPRNLPPALEGEVTLATYCSKFRSKPHHPTPAKVGKKTKDNNKQKDKDRQAPPEPEEAGPVVQINDDGEIVLQESSMVVEARGGASMKRVGQNIDDDETYTVVEEDADLTIVGADYSSFKETTKSKTWTPEETKLFYEALRQVGTDFMLMSEFFKGRNRKQLKYKYRKELTTNPKLIDKALHPSQQKPMDMSVFEITPGQVQEQAEATKQREIDEKEAKAKAEAEAKSKKEEAAKTTEDGMEDDDDEPNDPFERLMEQLEPKSAFERKMQPSESLWPAQAEEDAVVEEEDPMMMEDYHHFDELPTHEDGDDNKAQREDKKDPEADEPALSLIPTANKKKKKPKFRSARPGRKKK